MPRSIHAFVQHAHNRHSLWFCTVIHDMAFNRLASITGANMTAISTRQRGTAPVFQNSSSGSWHSDPLAEDSNVLLCTAKCFPYRATLLVLRKAYPCRHNILCLNAIASNISGAPLFSPSINAARIASSSAARSCSRRIRSRIYSLSLV